MWQKKSIAKLQSDTLWRQELQKSQSMQSTINSRADFQDMALKPKASFNQETKISDNVLSIQRNITQKQQGSGNSGDEFDTKIASDLVGLSNSPFSIEQRWMASRSSFTRSNHLDQNDSPTNKFVDHQHKTEISNDEYVRIEIDKHRKHSGEGTEPWGTQGNKVRGTIWGRYGRHP
jgi:hypothetical protein